MTHPTYRRPFSPENIDFLRANEVFVFGSNLQGRHGGGAARLAYRKFGAMWGQGVGWFGQTYAIPTMHGGVEAIRPYVDQFIAFARAHGELTFLVTRIGCGIAGFRDEEMAPLFAAALALPNVLLPEPFVRCLEQAEADMETSKAACRPHGMAAGKGGTFEERFTGCLLGGAAGDALGYAVEFDRWPAIEAQYGPEGIVHFAPDAQGRAEISDDTQMTLFTANGLLAAEAHGVEEGDTERWAGFVEAAYLEWLQTQTGQRDPDEAEHLCWIRDIPALNQRRGPGLTCLSALTRTSRNMPVRNDSCGCGGVMRMAPVGLFFARRARMAGQQPDWAALLHVAAECARCTHQHPQGYLPAALLAYVVARLALAEQKAVEKGLEAFVEAGLQEMAAAFPGQQADVHELRRLLHYAEELAQNGGPDRTNIGRLGEGWVGHEALAIALYCTCRHRDDFGLAIRAAVNHSGDSDSTGAITGNLMGAMWGLQAIPADYLQRLELRGVIEEMARDLCAGPADTPDRTTQELDRWIRKYRYGRAEQAHKADY